MAGYEPDLQLWLAEIEAQAEMQAGCLEMVDALDAIRLVQRLEGPQFGQQHLRNKQVHEIRVGDRTAVRDRGPLRLRIGTASLTQFIRRRIHVDLIQKSDHDRIDHIERATKSDLGQLHQPASICVLCVHLPAFA